MLLCWGMPKSETADIFINILYGYVIIKKHVIYCYIFMLYLKKYNLRKETKCASE